MHEPHGSFGRYLNYHQAAHYLGFSEAALRVMVCRGRIPVIRKGSGKRCVVRFDREDLDEWMNRDKVMPELQEAS